MKQAKVKKKAQSQAEREEWVQAAIWGLAAAVCVFAIYAWGQFYHWRFNHFSSYQLFPLFGLLAFSLMWTHYIAGSIRRAAGLPLSSIRSYLRITGWVVLVLICLHPGLLVYQLWRDGFGLPPGSYLKNFVAPSMEWIAILGTVSLFVFLAYETGRFFGKKSWWKYVVYTGDAAMLAILYHGLRLGDTLRVEWYRTLWTVYAILYVFALVYNYSYDRRSAHSQARPVKSAAPKEDS